MKPHMSINIFDMMHLSFINKDLPLSIISKIKTLRTLNMLMNSPRSGQRKEKNLILKLVSKVKKYVYLAMKPSISLVHISYNFRALE
jgi:hypothetical protein